MEEFIRKTFADNLEDKNNLSYWYPKIKDCGIKTPDTIVIPINYAQFKWLGGDNYEDKDIKSMGTFIHNRIKSSELKNNKKLFMKTGTFSNKFNFASCKIEDFDTIGEQFLDIYYAAMCVGDGNSTEIVIREFIESDNDIKPIYNGMPLSTEFRIFYDFDNKKILGEFNYWDRETVAKSLRYEKNNDAEIFLSEIDRIENNFTKYIGKVTELINKCMKNVTLEGKWSIDIMKAKDEFYLIDMATAETSYYYNRLNKEM